MRLFLPIINNVPTNVAYKALNKVCDALGLDYSSASKGKRSFKVGDNNIVLHEINDVVKCKPRGQLYKTKAND